MESGFFTENNSSEVVAGRIANTTDPRFKEIMTVLINHLHAAIKEIEPTQEEWFQAIEFLTSTGHMCDDWRQEFILLSDVLGVSMLVDAIKCLIGNPMRRASTPAVKLPKLPLGTQTFTGKSKRTA